MRTVFWPTVQRPAKERDLQQDFVQHEEPRGRKQGQYRTKQKSHRPKTSSWLMWIVPWSFSCGEGRRGGGGSVLSVSECGAGDGECRPWGGRDVGSEACWEGGGRAGEEMQGQDTPSEQSSHVGRKNRGTQDAIATHKEEHTSSFLQTVQRPAKESNTLKEENRNRVKPKDGKQDKTKQKPT